MSEPILIIGTRALAKALGVGRNQILAWLADPGAAFPAARASAKGAWVATRQNLVDWSDAYFAGRRPGNGGPGPG
jgi:hypothetical protein